MKSIELSYREAGQSGNPLVICLHGFPDDSSTFDELLPVLAAEGYHAVAPATRGYAPSEIPADGDYSLMALSADVLRLMDRLGAEKAVVVGHDWGAITGYALANFAPERVSKLVALAIPHLGAVSLNPLSAFRFSQFFVLPWGKVSEAVIAKDDFSYIDRAYARWSPTWRGPGVEAQVARIKGAFREPGRLGAAIGYYRSFRRDALSPARLKVYRAKTSVPTLTIYGENDGASSPGDFKRSPKYFTGPYKLVRVSNAGHFVHRENPKDTTAAILGFLKE